MQDQKDPSRHRDPAETEHGGDVTGKAWSPLQAEQPQVPVKEPADNGHTPTAWDPTGQKPHLTSQHPLPTPKRCRTGLQPGLCAEQLGFGFSHQRTDVCFSSTGLLKCYKSSGSPPISLWRSFESPCAAPTWKG